MLLTAPDPTIEELYDALAASGIRLDKVWAGVKEILGAKLPGMVDLYNLKNARAGANELQKPDNYHTGGVDLPEKPLPCIVVGAESEFLPLGPGAQMSNNTTCIWVVTAAKTSGAQVRDAALLADLARGVMLGYQRGYRNSIGQHLWTGLAPGSVRAIGKNEQSLYGGFYLSLDVVQGPHPQGHSLYEPGASIP